jgi:hypothetical protein
MAQGGITSVPSYDVGGEIKGQLASMEVEDLERQANESSSKTVREMAKQLLREKKMAQGAGPTGPMGVDYQAPQLAGGGIIAFAKPEEKNNYSLVEEDYSIAPNRSEKVARNFDENPAGGILGNASTSLAKRTPMTAERAIPMAPETSSMGDPYLSNMMKQQFKYDQESKRSVEDLAAEKEAAMGPNVAAQEYRKQIMDERANSKDEANRQRWMRAAQFFAKWGSTPGPVLVAGMNALNEKLPDIITDEQTYKKIKRDIDRSIFDLDNATRLEKAGYRKESQAEIAKARDIAAQSWSDINKYMGTVSGHKISAEASMYAANKNFEGDKLKAAATAANTSALRQGSDEAKAYNQATILKKEVADVYKDIGEEQAKPNGEYGKILEKINSYSQMTNRTTEQDEVLNKAQARKDAMDTAYQKRITTAEQNAKAAEQRYLNMSGYKKPGENTAGAPAGAPTATPPEGLPTGSRLIGKDKKTGADVYESPDGKRYVGS